MTIPDQGRCTHRFAPDRRCRETIEHPGATLCRYHRTKRDEQHRPNEPRHPAADAFFNWLCHNPLDTFTAVNQAINQLVLLLAAGAISQRTADAHLRQFRLIIKILKDVRKEHEYPNLTSHKPAGEKFLAQLRQTIIPAARTNDEPPSSQGAAADEGSAVALNASNSTLNPALPTITAATQREEPAAKPTTTPQPQNQGSSVFICGSTPATADSSSPKAPRTPTVHIGVDPLPPGYDLPPMDPSYEEHLRRVLTPAQAERAIEWHRTHSNIRR